jgi:gamma-glutamyl phosphate reductase
VRECEQCDAEYESAAQNARFCSAKCRKAAFKARQEIDGTATERRVSAVAAVTSDLEAAGRLETYLGAAALALAERIDSSTAVMGFAALVKELRSTMDAALAGVVVAADPVDELRSRRDRKYAG